MTLKPRRRIVASENPRQIRRALQVLDQEAADRSAYTILYKNGQSIGEKLDELEARVAALEG